MFTWLVDKIVGFFSICFQGLSWVFSFICNHLWALFVSIWTIIFSVFNSILETVKGWIFSVVPPLQNLGDLSFGDSLGDVIDNAIMSNLGSGFISDLGKDVFYMFSVGDFFVSASKVGIKILVTDTKKSPTENI